MEDKSKITAKRNIYLALLAIAVIAIIVTVTIAIAVNSNKKQIEVPKSSTQTNTKSTSVPTSNSTPSSVTPPPSSSSNPTSSDNDKPTATEIVFTMPVIGGTVINEYTAASVAYNKTLGIYTGHMAVDFGGEEGANVVAAYDGIISDITTSYLEGTTVTITHGDVLKTVYNSIEPLETLEKGQNVKAGDVLGVISTNNRQEYKDGAHLHFAVYENDKTVDPFKYLAVNAK